MSRPIDELKDKLEMLIQLRKEEEEKYGRLLTLLDQTHLFPLLLDSSPRLDEIKSTLNNSWDIQPQAQQGTAGEQRYFWKDVAANTAEWLKPFVQQQREFNSLSVHLLNELTGAVSKALGDVRDFHHTLILFFQRIVPLIDTKYREMEGEYLAALDHTDLLYQQLDQRIETLRMDVNEQQQASEHARTSLRSLHHLANALATAAATPGKVQHPGEEYRYYHFEEQFRGSREEISAKFGPYLEFYSGLPQGPVLDLGCGRGEFLELLKGKSIPGIGVDSNAKMVQSCRDMGLDVYEDDLLKFLQTRKSEELAGIFCSQVVEHLPPDYLLNLLECAFTRIKPGGVMVLETVNVSSAFGFLQVYTKDLTHRTPVHPATLQFLVAACGFQNPQIIQRSPVPAVAQLKLFADEAGDEMKAVFNQNMKKLNELLYGYQDYAVVAKK